MATAKLDLILKGDVRTWSVGGQSRRYSVVDLPFSEAEQIFGAEPFIATTNKGEQRDLKSRHLQNLKEAYLSGNYTPVPVCVGLRKRHLDKIEIKGDKFTLEVNDKLPTTDGNHRLSALKLIKNQVSEALASEDERVLKRAYRDIFGEETQENPTPEAEIVRVKFNELLEEIDTNNITAIVHIDGDTQTDFIHLQMGLPVDKAHLLSLSVKKKIAEADVTKAWELAKKLSKSSDSWFYNAIRFDSHGESGYPITTLCSTGKSEICNSLVGAVRAAPEKNVDWLYNVFVQVQKILEEGCSEALQGSKALTPPPNGSRGAATMIVGVSTMAAFRLDFLGKNKLSDEDVQALIKAVNDNLNVEMIGSFAAPQKRSLMYNFGCQFLGDLETERTQDMPNLAIQRLSASCFGIKLPKKEPKAKKGKKGETETVAA